jgi:hypothetical protein
MRPAKILNNKKSEFSTEASIMHVHVPGFIDPFYFLFFILLLLFVFFNKQKKKINNHNKQNQYHHK